MGGGLNPHQVPLVGFCESLRFNNALLLCVCVCVYVYCHNIIFDIAFFSLGGSYPSKGYS